MELMIDIGVAILMMGGWILAGFEHSRRVAVEATFTAFRKSVTYETKNGAATKHMAAHIYQREDRTAKVIDEVRKGASLSAAVRKVDGK